jgi:hypothetical protein
MQSTPDERAATYRPSDAPIETPPEDAAEQATYADPLQATESDEPVHRGLEVNEADAAEQARSVGIDDEY